MRYVHYLFPQRFNYGFYLSVRAELNANITVYFCRGIQEWRTAGNSRESDMFLETIEPGMIKELEINVVIFAVQFRHDKKNWRC
jgi:hypothetical protein